MADRRGKVDGVGNPVAAARIDGDELFALAHFHRLQNAQRFAPPPLLANTHARKGLHVGQGAAIQNGQFQVIDLDNHVIDAHADESREQMFGGGDQDALAHQACGVADFGHVAPGGRNLEVVEIGAPKDDARPGSGRQQPHRHRGSGVQPDAREFKRSGDRLFEVRRLSQEVSPNTRNRVRCLD